ncbi:MAG: Trk system potassium transporter TrkA [Thermodesulfovibrionales bacterium]
MHVIIVGAGEVGYQIAKFLSRESTDVIVIDKDKNKLKRIVEELDVAVVEGEGGNPSALKEAEADKADILLAVTDRDETNMIACLLAKVFNIPRKIARIRNPDYFKNVKLLSKENLDIDPAINPDLEIARAIVRLLEVPIATDIEEFEGGIIRVIGFKIPENTPLIGKTLRELGKTTSKKFLIGLVEREDKVIVPSGGDRLKSGDIVYMPVKKWDVGDAIAFLGLSAKPAKNIMLLGGGRTGYHIASVIESKAEVKIIEKDKERCEYLSKNLKKTLVLHGDGGDQKLLLEENVGDMDIFAAVSNNDELNIMASLLAKKLGAKKTIAIVNKTDYISLAHGLGLQAVLCPRLITASTILRYVRRGDILSLTAIAEDKAEIIEARICKTSLLIGKTLEEAQLNSSVIGAIIRGEDVIIPSGRDRVLEGDKLIIFTLRESIKEVEKFLM